MKVFESLCDLRENERTLSHNKSLYLRVHIMNQSIYNLVDNATSSKWKKNIGPNADPIPWLVVWSIILENGLKISFKHIIKVHK